MKRIISIAFIVCLVGAALAGCSNSQEHASGNERSTVVEVSTVDEFLRALASDTEIHLKPGIYNLSQAATYGKPTGSTAYRWADVYDGYSLELSGIENLVICGAGLEETSIVSNAPWANVLQLKKCHNVRFSGFTAGHSGIAESSCTGSVMNLQSSENLHFSDLGLFGCGEVGLDAISCRDMILENSRIYDCSFSGMNLTDSKDILIHNCSFSELGNANSGYTVWQLNNTENVHLSDCSVTGCNLVSLASNYSARGSWIENLTISGCRFSNGFQNDSEMVVDGIAFSDTRVNRFIPLDYGTILDSRGEVLTEEKLCEMFPETVPEDAIFGQAYFTPVTFGTQKEITVSTADEFLAAIGSNTKIILDSPLIVLADASGYGSSYSEYYYWADEYDGPGLVIHDVENFSICASSDDYAQVEIHSVPRYANVLSFENCRNVEVSGFTAGHSDGEGYCSGGVLHFSGCKDVLVNRCGLFGCGTLGVDAVDCADFQIANCDIYECSYGGITMNSCQRVSIGGCRFSDLGGSAYGIFGCENVTINGDDYFEYYYGD